MPTQPSRGEQTLSREAGASRPETADADDRRPGTRLAEELDLHNNAEQADEEIFADNVADVPVVKPKPVAAVREEEPPAKRRKQDDDSVNDGIMAALSKLRKDGG